VNEKIDGKGVIKFIEGSFLEGDFVKGKVEGVGKIIFADGD
jgi:hypothetical protein